MLTGSYDEKCPKCRHVLPLYDLFISADYKSDFTMECPACNQELQVYVHAVPEFEVFDAKREKA